MKVRYFGFLSPSYSMPIDEIRGRIEMARGFMASAKEASTDEDPPTSPALACPHCGGKLRFCSVVLPRPLGSRALTQVDGMNIKPNTD